MGSIIDKYDGKKSFLKLSLPYLVAAAAPMDLRTVVQTKTATPTQEDELQMLIDAGCVYDGMKVWVVDEGKEYIYRAGENRFKPYQIDTAATIDHLTVTKQIQGHDFNGTQDVESGFVYPEQLTILDGQTLDNVLEKATNTDQSLLLKAGFYYCTINNKNISVVMERIGAKVITSETKEEDNVQITTYIDQSIYKFTLTTIDSGIIKTQYCVSQYDSDLRKRTLNWKTVEYCANNNVIELNSNLTIDGLNVNFAGEFGGDEAEKWLVAIHGNDAIPANADKIIDRNGREFSFDGGVTEAVSVPFIVKLIGQNAYVVNIKADSINFGLVRLSDSYIDDQNGVNSGVAATPKAVAGLNATLSGIISGKAPNNHASAETTYGIGTGSNYGHVKLVDNLNNDSDADSGKAATPKAIYSLYNQLITHRKCGTTSQLQEIMAKGKATADDYGHVKLGAADQNGATAASGVAAPNGHTHSQYLTQHQDISGKAPNNHASTGTTYGVGTSINYGHVKLGTVDQNGATAANGVAAPNGHTHSQYIGRSVLELLSLGFDACNFVVAIIHYNLGTGSIKDFELIPIFGGLQIERRTNGYVITSSDQPGSTYGLWFEVNKSYRYRGIRIGNNLNNPKIMNGTTLRKTVGLTTYQAAASNCIAIGDTSGGDFLIIGY